MSTKTYNVITSYLQLERDIGAYHAAAESRDLTEQFYTNAANLINASSPSEIAFMDSASRGWNMAVYGVDIQPGDKIVTLASEFGTNLITLFDRAQQVGATVRVIKCDIAGNFSLDDFENELKNGARIIAISHAVAHGSIINPVIEIGILAKRYGAIYIVDGCQAVGQFHVDVKSIQCDAYMITGRKWLCGPRGAGFLYIKSSTPFRTTQLDLASADLVIDNEFNVLGVKVRTDAKQFELWERSIACMLGLSAAIYESIEIVKGDILNRIQLLSNRLRTAVIENNNLNLIGKLDSKSGIVGFYLKEPTREDLVRDEFKKNGIGISSMSDWDCPLHFPKNGAKGIFRLSPHYYTDDSTVLAACDVLSKI